MAYSLQQVVNAAYLKATRKAVGLDLTSTKGLQMVGLADFNQKDWANDPGIDWTSLRQVFTVPAPITATNTFSIASLTTMNHISKVEGDYVRITSADGKQEWDYTIVDPSMLYNNGSILNSGSNPIGTAYGTCAQMGTNLIFARSFVATDAQIGGTIKLPGTVNVNTLALAADIIQVDDPQWLIVKMAADYCFNDVTRINLYPALNDEATDKYDDMVKNNESQITTAYTPSINLGGVTW